MNLGGLTVMALFSTKSDFKKAIQRLNRHCDISNASDWASVTFSLALNICL